MKYFFAVTITAALNETQNKMFKFSKYRLAQNTTEVLVTNLTPGLRYWWSITAERGLLTSAPAKAYIQIGKLRKLTQNSAIFSERLQCTSSQIAARLIYLVVYSYN